MVLRNPEGAPSVEDLAVGINAVSGSIETAGHGERLLCAVFAFVDAHKHPIYFIYNYKRGYWYPFVPGPAAMSSSARPSASCSSRRRSARNCRSSRNSSAGSRCGASRSRPTRSGRPTSRI